MSALVSQILHWRNAMYGVQEKRICRYTSCISLLVNPSKLEGEEEKIHYYLRRAYKQDIGFSSHRLSVGDKPTFSRGQVIRDRISFSCLLTKILRPRSPSSHCSHRDATFFFQLRNLIENIFPSAYLHISHMQYPKGGNGVSTQIKRLEAFPSDKRK